MFTERERQEPSLVTLPAEPSVPGQGEQSRPTDHSRVQPGAHITRRVHGDEAGLRARHRVKVRPSEGNPVGHQPAIPRQFRHSTRAVTKAESPWVQAWIGGVHGQQRYGCGWAGGHHRSDTAQGGTEGPRLSLNGLLGQRVGVSPPRGLLRAYLSVPSPNTGARGSEKTHFP